MPTISEVLQSSKQLTKANIKPLLILQLAPLLGIIIFGLLGFVLSESGGIFKVLFGLLAIPMVVAFMYVSFLVALATDVLILHRIDNKDTSLKQIIELSQKKLLRYLGASILYVLGVLGGLLLLVIPGIYFAVKYIFVFPLIADTDMKVKESFTEAARMTKGKLWFVGKFILAFIGIGIFVTIISNLLGSVSESLNFIVGNIASLLLGIFISVALVVLYRSLKTNAAAPVITTADTPVTTNPVV